MDVVQGATHLIYIQLHKHGGHALPRLGIMFTDAMDRLWHVFQHQILPHLILLRGHVEAMLQLDYIRVAQHLHDLQLSILVPFVLQDLLDCYLQNHVTL